MTTVADHIRTARAAEAAMLRIDLHGGGTMGTIRAMERHAAKRRAAEAALMEAGRRDIVGLLTEEASLAYRVAMNRADGADRPELRERLRAVRRTLRAVRRTLRARTYLGESS